MRKTQIFSGSSHPALVEAICDRLGQKPAQAELGKFANGETKIQIQTSVRDQDVFIVQSGSNTINDAVMELLIMCSACKGGSAKSVTAVVPYFPYSRQSKKKSHRGAITARMLANLLDVAGVNHIITIDLHASQMQGFFKCPVDNLVAEPLLAQWIKANIPDWRASCVVSKNPGGTKRVTSLADALKLSFGIIMTDRRRPGSMAASLSASTILDGNSPLDSKQQRPDWDRRPTVTPLNPHGSPLQKVGINGIPEVPQNLAAAAAAPLEALSLDSSAPESPFEEYEDDGIEPSSSSQIITGRLVHGRIVDDDADAAEHSPHSMSAHSASANGRSDDDVPEQMVSSMYSNASSVRNAAHSGLGGSGDAADSDDDEEENLRNPDSTVTLVGNVRDKQVLIVDDMIDKAGSWIAAAETVVKRGGATKVYCMATHGLLGGDCIQQLEDCPSIHKVIVTNAFPIPLEKQARAKKLVMLDVSGLLSEAIRRNHHGESISNLFQHYDS